MPSILPGPSLGLSSRKWAMIIYVFISFSTVQIYDISYIHLYVIIVFTFLPFSLDPSGSYDSTSNAFIFSLRDKITILAGTRYFSPDEVEVFYLG